MSSIFWKLTQKVYYGTYGKIGFEVTDPAVLFPEVFQKPSAVSLMNVPWQWGDTTNGNAIIFLCELAAAGYCPIVEFGTNRGRTTLDLALNTKNEKIYTIDFGQFQDDSNMERHHYKKVRVGELFLDADKQIRDKIEMITGDSTKLDLSHLKGKAGLVIVDGGHSYDVCLSDSNNALSLVRKGGVVVWDDYGNYWPGVKKAINEIAKSKQLYYLRNESLVVYKNA